MDPSQMTEIAKSVTKDDVRHLIRKGYIAAEKKKGVPRYRGRARSKRKLKGRMHGLGRRRGKAGARSIEKQEWMARIRAQRQILKDLHSRGLLSNYREIYMKAKGGAFRDKAHLLSYLREKGLLKGTKIR